MQMLGNAVLVSNNETENVTDENAKTTSPSSETTETKTENETDYYANAKLNRDKMYAEMISNYEKIIKQSKCIRSAKINSNTRNYQN